MDEKKSKGKTIKLEFSQITLWKTGTIVFGILFIISLLTGGFNEIGDEANDDEAEAPTQQAAPTKIDAKVGDAYVKGDDKASVAVIEYSDFQCPFCERFYKQTLPSIMKNFVDNGKAKFAYKHLPLGFHPYAQKAAEASECAGVQGKFYDMHDKIFENQQAITTEDLKKYAGDLGLDKSKFDKCLDGGEMEKKVKAHLAEANGLGITGTPSSLVVGPKKEADVDALKALQNGQSLVYYESTDGKNVVFKVVGAQPYESFEKVLKAMTKGN